MSPSGRIWEGWALRQGELITDPERDIGKSAHERCARRWGRRAHALERRGWCNPGKDQMWLWRPQGAGEADACWRGSLLGEAAPGGGCGQKTGVRIGVLEVSAEK